MTHRVHGRAALAGIVAAAALGSISWAVADQADSSPRDRVELLRQAEERLIAQCMARHGFAYTEQPPSTEREFRHVVDDVDWAREHGYGTALGGSEAWERDVNSAVVDKLPPDRQRAWQRTLLGSGRQLTADVPDLGQVQAPDNGCTADARRTLYQDLPGWYRVRRIADHLEIYVSNAVMADASYRAARGEWARCVRQRGYAAESPEELRGLVAEQSTQHQRPAAVTEARCATSTTFAETIRQLERKHRPEIERRFQKERRALAAYESDAAGRAEAILVDS